MTELEIIERAKMYMDKLANGINPLDDSVVPEQDVINQVRLSRCFFFVSDVLRRVIENGGVEAPSRGRRKVQKLPFALPAEQRNGFAFSDRPIAISDFTKRVNALINTDEMESLKYSSITGWLVSVGMLVFPDSSGQRKTKTPTPQGNQIGISSEERIGQSGPYTGVFYNEEAQHFILDNLDAILEYERASTELQGQPWTPQHDQCLMDLYRKGVSTAEIAVTLKRNSSSVQARIRKLSATEQKDL